MNVYAVFGVFEKPNLVSLFLISMVITACGGGSGGGESRSDRLNASTSSLQLGTGAGASFDPGMLDTSIPDHSNLPYAGETTVSVNVVDSADNALVSDDSVTVNFSSECVTNGEANIDESVETSGGRAVATYQALTCEGEDTIRASLESGSTASIAITIAEQTTDHQVSQQTPKLFFSDLISGPDTGIGDGVGSGVIVTLWGTNLGDNQENSTVEFCDSLSVCRAAPVYYWKNADGQLPGGPANLYESHGMQEIAVSIPDSANGAGEITVTTGQGATSVPFVVRDGRIFHIKSSGDDSTGDGSFDNPWQTVEMATSNGSPAGAGATVYVHDVASGDSMTYRGIYWSNSSALSSKDAQFGLIAYPNTRPTTTGKIGISSYRTAGLVFSKFDVYSSNYLAVDANDQPMGAQNVTTGNAIAIQTTRDGRTVANRITDIPGGCSSRTAGAISGSSKFDDYVSNHRIYGNEIYEYGCAGSSKLQHTTYMTIRSAPDNEQIVPWEFGYNYLHDNKTKNGIHVFDQDEGCGDLTGDLLIHNNVVTNQGGAGIAIGLSGCDWYADSYIYNNVLINTGLPAAWDGIDVNTSDGASTDAISIWDSGYHGMAYIYNNTVYNWNASNVNNGANSCFGFSGSSDNVAVIFNNNLCVTEADKPFVGAGYQAGAKLDNISGQNNLLFYAGDSPVNAIVPNTLTNTVTDDPLLTVVGPQVQLDDNSPVIDAGVPMIGLTHGVYGVARDDADIGAVEVP